MFKSIETFHTFDTVNDIEDATFSGDLNKWKIPYLLLTVATTLWCTILILYRIISVVGSSYGVGIRSYYKVIEALVESAALYSAILIIDIVFVAHNILSGTYVEVLGIAIRVCLLQSY